MFMLHIVYLLFTFMIILIPLKPLKKTKNIADQNRTFCRIRHFYHQILIQTQFC